MGDGEPAAPARQSVAAVLDKLREQILDRTLQPGEQIRQEDMARRLGVSRVPLREALRVLTTEGLLTHRLHQGYFVATLNTAALRQIHTLLEFLETELLRTVRWPDDEEIAAMRSVNRTMVDAARVGDVAAVNRLNHEFHSQIFSLSPLEIYLAEAERFWALSEPYRLLHVTTTDVAIAAEQHEQLIDALAVQDRVLCLRILTEHRKDTQIAAHGVLARLESTPPRAVG